MSKHRLFVFYRQIYRRALIQLELGSGELKLHDDAVRRVEYFAGRPLDVVELTDDLLNRFADHLRSREATGGAAAALVHAIERIRRSFNPPHFRIPKLSLMEPDPQAGTLRDLYARVYRPQRLIGCSEENAEIYVRMLRQLRIHFGKDLLISELTDSIAATHFSWLLDRGLKAKTVNTGHRSPLLALWRLAYDERMIDRLPRVKRLKEGLRVPDAWTVDEMNQLLANCGAASKAAIAGIPAAIFWEAMLRVAWWTGLRRGTLLKLRRADFNMATGWLTVSPEIIKNRRGATFRLGPDAAEAIAGLLLFKPREKLLFPWPHNPRTLNLHFERILVAAGLPRGESCMGHFHKIRRSTATKVAELAGVGAASSLLGHSSSVITQRYIDPSKLPGNDLTAMLPGLEIRRPEPPDRAAG